MGNATGISRALLLLALLPALLAVSACVQADTSLKQFDVPAQSAGPALNEFARQADITLIFSYDLVAGDRTRELKGRFTVDQGLTRLLKGTRLAYKQAADGIYLICQRHACGLLPTAEAVPPIGRKTDTARVAEMHLPPVSMTVRRQRRGPESISGERMQPCEAVLR